MERPMTARRCRALLPAVGAASLFAGVLTAAVATATPAGADPFGPSTPPFGAQTTLYVSASSPQQPTPGAPGQPGSSQPAFGQPGFGRPGFGKPGFGQPGFGQQSYSCNNAQYSTISAAVAAAQTGSTIYVCAGTYDEDVVVTESLTITGSGAVVNPGTATNSPYASAIGNNAFTVLAPNVTIEGFTVEDATGDGILSAGDHSTIVNNTAINNGGTGIDLNGSSWSTVSGNTATGNAGGGVYLTNDAANFIAGATASHDTVTGNVTDDNPGGCGIILADHFGSTSGVNTTQGIFDNTIQGNRVEGNGNDPVGSGSGIVLATEAPGGAVYNNTIEGNTIDGNGLAGVTLHSHLAGQDLSGNIVVGNDIGTNNLGGDYGDPSTTGVYVGSVGPLTITVSGNVIHDDADGIFSAGPVTVNGSYFNFFQNVPTPSGTDPTYAG
jgi:parallel beta-helix repeat protein